MKPIWMLEQGGSNRAVQPSWAALHESKQALLKNKLSASCSTWHNPSWCEMLCGNRDGLPLQAADTTNGSWVCSRPPERGRPSARLADEANCRVVAMSAKCGNLREAAECFHKVVFPISCA